MSTTTRNSLTYADYIAACVRHVANKLRGEDVAVALLQLLSGVLIYLVVAIALDHALALSWQIRTVLLVLAVGVAAWHTVRHIAIPLLRRVNEWYVARTIDRVAPELADGMTTVLELERGGDDPAIFLARPIVEDRVVRILARMDVTERVGSDQLLRAWYLLAASVVLVCLGVLLNSLLAQRSLMSSLARVLIPWADVAYPTRTRIVDVRPGDDPELSKAVAGSDVQVSAIVQGAVPEAVYLYWSVDGGQTWRRIPMKRPLTSLDPWLVTLEDVEQSFVYYLEGGDCKTETYRFTVVPVPVVQAYEIYYQPPEYTGQAPYTSDLPDIEAVEGTRVTVTARLPEPVKRAELVLGPDKRRRLPMHRVPGKQDTVRASFDVVTDDVYRIWFTLESGATNPNPPVHQIKCLRDRPPVVRITEPGRDLVDPPVPIDAEIPIVVEASDDFGLRVVELVWHQPGQGGHRRELLFDGLKERRTTGEFRFRLSAGRFGLRAGEELVYWVEAVDNKRPGAQKAESQKYRVKFAAANRAEAVPEPRQQEEERTGAKEEKPGTEGQQAEGRNKQEGETEEGKQEVGEQGSERVEDPEQALEEIARFLEEMEQQKAEEEEQGGSKESAEQAGRQEGDAAQEPAAEGDRGEEQAGSGQMGEGKSGEQGESREQSGKEPEKAGREQEGGAGQQEAGREQSGEAGVQGVPEPSPEKSARQRGETGEEEGKAEPGARQGGGEKGAEDTTAPPQGGKTEPGAPTKRDLPDLPEGVGLTGTRTGNKGEKGGASGATEQGEAAPGETAAPDGGEGQGTGAPTGQRRPDDGGGRPGESASPPGARRAGQPTKTPPRSGSAGAGSEPGPRQPASGASSSGAGKTQSGGANEGGRGQQANQTSQKQPGGAAGQGAGAGGTKQPSQGAAPGKSASSSAGQQGQGAAQPSGSGQRGQAEGAGGPANKDGKPGGGSQGTPGGQGGQPTPTAQPGGGAPTSGGSQGRTPGGVAGQQQGGASQGAGAAPVAGTGERPRRAAPAERGAAGGAPGEGTGPQGADAGGVGGEGAQGVRAPELVLKRLEDMLRNDRVDERLLKRLGWTRRDLERFVKYMKARQVRQPRRRSGTPQSRLLTSGPGTSGSAEDAALQVGGAKPPMEYKELVEAYTRSLSAAGDREQ